MNEAKGSLSLSLENAGSHPNGRLDEKGLEAQVDDGEMTTCSIQQDRVRCNVWHRSMATLVKEIPFSAIVYSQATCLFYSAIDIG